MFVLCFVQTKIVITPKDDKSGIITAMVKDSVDNYQEEQMLYEDLTENWYRQKQQYQRYNEGKSR